MFKYISTKEQLLKERGKNELYRAKQEEIENATSIAFVALAENGIIDEVTVAEHTALFSPWAANITYTVGALCQCSENLYRCVQGHTSQDDWTPDVTPSLWTKVGDPTVEYPEWSQPIGAHDAYMNGDKVTYNGQHWISTADNNVWQPGVYGWEAAE